MATTTKRVRKGDRVTHDGTTWTVIWHRGSDVALASDDHRSTVIARDDFYRMAGV